MPPARTRPAILVAIWLAILIPWTWALLRPIPEVAKKALAGTEISFWFSKTLHVSVYATLGGLTVLLPVSRRWRAALVLLLIAHGGATEYLQQFVEGRGASWRDFLLDTAGVLLGVRLVTLSRRWYGFESRRREAQVRLESQPSRKDAQAADL